MFAGLFILLVLVNGIVCGGANRGSRYNLEVVRGSRGISQMQQLIPHQASKQVHVDDESTVSDTRFEDHEDKVTSGTRIQKNRINGNDRAWFSSGPGWDVRVDLRMGSNNRRVSSLDWANRWEQATDCLSSQEPDNVDMFEMDELALEAFWDRVWECYLPYAYGLDDSKDSRE